MAFASSHLRLVGAPEPDHEAAAAADERARLAIMKENRIAAHAGALQPGFADAIDPHDPRWVLAMQTQARLQGSILTPERRDELQKNGRKLGLRPFEANMIIALVQDRARRGGTAGNARPALSLVSAAPDRTPQDVTWPRWFAAIAAAAAVTALLARWILG